MKAYRNDERSSKAVTFYHLDYARKLLGHDERANRLFIEALQFNARYAPATRAIAHNGERAPMRSNP